MTVTIHIHPTHRQWTAGEQRVAVSGKTVGECLGVLVERFPAFEPVLFDQNQALRNTVEIYLNMASAYPNELARPVKNGDEIHITLLLAGG